MYTSESLIKINAAFQETHRIQQTDVDIANDIIKIIEKSRTDDKIQVGDIVEFTTSHGDYYKNAHIENIYGNKSSEYL